MKAKVALGLALSLTCISAAESPSNYRTYTGYRVDSNPFVLGRYESALEICAPEAATPPRGTPYPRSLHYNAGLRACLYRYGFIDRGHNAYPGNLIFDHFLDR